MVTKQLIKTNLRDERACNRTNDFSMVAKIFNIVTGAK